MANSQKSPHELEQEVLSLSDECAQLKSTVKVLEQRFTMQCGLVKDAQEKLAQSFIAPLTKEDAIALGSRINMISLIHKVGSDEWSLAIVKEFEESTGIRKK